MAVAGSRVTVGNTPVALNVASAGGSRLLVKNTSANAADLGGPTVAATTGFDLAAGASVDIQLGPFDVLFAIRSGGVDATVSVIRRAH